MKLSINIWSSLIIAMLACCSIAAGQDKPADVTGRHFKTDILSASAEGFVARGAFEIAGPAHRWYEVRFQILLNAETTLQFSDSRPMVLSWGNVFTPHNIANPQWTDCQLKVPAAYLNAASNLPKAARNVLYVTCELWDFTSEKYLGSGWNARAPVIVTTDESGKVAKIELFNTDQMVLLPSHPTESMEVRECRLETKNLRLKGESAAYRSVDIGNEVHDVLLSGELRCDIRSNSRGYFFQPVDSAEKAGELAAMGYPGAVVIKTAEQYKAIVSALRVIGSRPGAEIMQENPPAFGFDVQAETKLGWRVKMLAIDRTKDGGFGNIVYRELCVGTDNSIGVRALVCVKAPEDPSAVEKYANGVKAIFSDWLSNALAQPLIVSNVKRTIACQATARSQLFLKVADWPAWAGATSEPAPTTAPADPAPRPLEPVAPASKPAK